MSNKKIKLFSLTENTKGRTITLPVVGDQKFDSEDNSIEVDSDKVSELMQLDFGIELSKENPSVKIDAEAKEENLEMLKGLNEEELEILLKEYHSKETKDLKTVESKIDYLAKKMGK